MNTTPLAYPLPCCFSVDNMVRAPAVTYAVLRESAELLACCTARGKAISDETFAFLQGCGRS